MKMLVVRRIVVCALFLASSGAKWSEGGPVPICWPAPCTVSDGFMK